MIKILSFDLDGTLVKSTYADKVWLEGLPVLYSNEKNIPIDLAKEKIYKLYEEVGQDKKEWYDIDWWFKKFDLNQSWKNLLDSYRDQIMLYPETIETLEELKNDFILIIISNAKREFIEIQLKETNLKPLFKYVFSSLSDFDAVKKTLDVYRKILNKLNIQPKELIHVGDNKEFDYESPQKIGIKSYYLNREKTEKGENVIFSLSELKDIVKKYLNKK